ncbi:MAG: Fosmidomycin resistance protein [Bacillus thermozeamaize]|uniref:Fosmidomycin resistance protein n=1 Tax=Bacillus thermozeamaize TaxID=230954 RepID=A0A1Y3PLZ0_9BACI|nr:MAG: Fosmidomycin resistance protein [Bacillus thermozeamaize]
MEVAAKPDPAVKPTLYNILLAISLVHLFNDTIQAVIPAIFPILRESMHLTYLQLGLVAFALNMTASIMQPVVGWYTDRHPSPYMLPIGMFFTMCGMIGLAFAPNFSFVLASVILVGLGSAVFHPEGSRVAYLSSGQRRGLGQSIFQVGGNSGQSLAPVMTALVFVNLGQFGAIWFAIPAGIAILVMMYIASWYRTQMHRLEQMKKKTAANPSPEADLQNASAHRRKLRLAMSLLIAFVFVRSWYHAGITNFYPFYLIEQYGTTVKEAQLYIFLFLAAGALGTFLGGPLADRFGRRNMILFSMLGSAPLSLLLPHVNAFWAYPLSLVIGFIVLSSFSVTVVYAQDLVPGKVGTVSGLIIGFAFGMGALGSVALGGLVDWLGVKTVMIGCGFLPLLGIVSLFLPSDKKLEEWASVEGK